MGAENRKPTFGMNQFIVIDSVVDGTPLIDAAKREIISVVIPLKDQPLQTQVEAVAQLIRENTSKFDYLSPYDVLTVILDKSPETLDQKDRDQHLQALMSAFEGQYLH